MSFFGAVPHFTLGKKNKSERLMCIRPADPTLAVARAESLAEQLHRGSITVADFDRQFQAMISLQEYRFVGFVRRPIKLNKQKESQLVNHFDEPIGWTAVGDSFVTANESNLTEARQS